MSVLTASDTFTRTDRWLDRAALLFTVAVLLHNLDHLRRGVDSIGRDVFAAGTAGIVLEVTVVVLICGRHRLAPIAAAVIGVQLAAGYVAVHFLPRRSWLSDSFVSAQGVSPLSWTAASLETVAALTIAIVGGAALRRRGGLAAARARHPFERTARQTGRAPLVLVMTAGNLVILLASLAQL